LTHWVGIADSGSMNLTSSLTVFLLAVARDEPIL